MPLHDLTPQLRTRLNRVERTVGWFVLLAILLLVAGFVYYLYNTAERKGWFVTKAPYFTFADRATGLKVGDPVKLMGFDVGRITRIDAMPPYHEFNVYIEFEIKDPYYGYLWTEGSVARLTPTDLFGQRTLEVTKGTKGYPTYMFNPLREISLAEAANLQPLQRFKLAEEIRAPDGTNILFHALTPLSKEMLERLALTGRTQIRLFDTHEKKKSMTSVWNNFNKRYETYARTNLYWLLSDETPALSERLEQLVNEVEKAVPTILALTNQFAMALENTASLASNMNRLVVHAEPAVSNLVALTSELRGPGQLGWWLLTPAQHAQVNATLSNLNSLIVNADTNVNALGQRLAESLTNLAGITSNLNAQLLANTNIVKSLSDAITHADEFVQGLKKHWLLRSAFKQKPVFQPLPPQRNVSWPNDYH